MAASDTSPIMGFHVSHLARDLYQFDQGLFVPIGKTNLPDFRSARTFAQQMNQKRDLVSFPEQAVRASTVNAVALVHGITQYVFRLYRQQQNPQMLTRALTWLNQQVGTGKIDETLDSFVDEFPPLAVYLRQMSDLDYLNNTTDGTPNREIILEEMLLLWLSNSNPAFSPFLELFGDDTLEQETVYNQVMADLYQFFGQIASEPPANESRFAAGQNIIDFLLAPVRASPHSVEAQLAFLLSYWSEYIGSFAYRLLRSLDLIKEEHRPVFGGPGPSMVPMYDLASLDREAERFTPDREWMPNLVLIAKNAYVWLDQLSKKYQRSITRVDQIPDAELDTLARWGVTGLWLIGLWERSRASQTIKQLCGNPDAVASAYSLLDYRIADALGGENASQNLRDRAWKRGIRLASDMVPNHVGIDGKWVMEHPDWFVSLPYSPFPSYTFNGPDLSSDAHIGIYVEDHYYNRSDAAVVFKRIDRSNGDERYIYHGNDGTSMPWNDTAQLNYLNPEVREAMIQTILRIARQFPIIRFDAAMTLVKKHFHRLWFPEPGSGGAIPSRAEHGMTRADFENIMTEEFWREVVDRAAVEAPDCLLLAEAFWLMEGYFVRTLGMHRVYNSAFMNMLRDEENAKYRAVMKNTLEFDPEVLRRYVNFMNNPDERTAVDQFGKGDKYFGVCTLMLTLPGLPMLGHGQIEGFTEKYGMEYRRAYWDEQPDQYLIQRHEREIFPLARKRYLFAGVDNFLLYDFFSPEGAVNENVYAYSNRDGDERGLVLCNNTYASARGWIRTSTAYMVKRGEERTVIQRSLGDGLGLPSGEDQFVIFREHRSNLEFIRSCKDLYEQGLYTELSGYQYHVFMDFRVVADTETHQYRQLAGYLGGRGVPSISEALQEIFVQPVQQPFKKLVNAETFRLLLDNRILKAGGEVDGTLLKEIEHSTIELLGIIREFIGQESDPSTEKATRQIARTVRDRVAAALELLAPDNPLLAKATKKLVKDLQTGLADDTAAWGGLFGWLFVQRLGSVSEPSDDAEQSRSWIDEWLLGRVISGTLRDLGVDEQSIQQVSGALKLMTGQQHLFEIANGSAPSAESLLTALLQDADGQQFLGVNRFQNVLWYNKEAFDQLLRWLLLAAAVTASKPSELAARHKVIEQLRKAAGASGYQVEKLRAGLAATTKPSSRKKAR